MVVDGYIPVDRIHALPDANLGSEVDNAVDTSQSPGQDIRIPYVAHDHLDLAFESLGRGTAAVDLLDEAVDDADAMATGQTGSRHISADEAGPSCDEDKFCHEGPRSGVSMDDEASPEAFRMRCR
jgi:hypothetical protein